LAGLLNNFMPNKEEALQYVRMIAQQKIATKKEVEAAYSSAIQADATDNSLTKEIGMAEIFYFVGAIVILLGIAIFLAQNWSLLGFTTKILATLGVSLVAYLVAVILSRNKKLKL